MEFLSSGFRKRGKDVPSGRGLGNREGKEKSSERKSGMQYLLGKCKREGLDVLARQERDSCSCHNGKSGLSLGGTRSTCM